MIDHTFIYTGAVRKMAEIVKAGELGRVYYYDSTRVNLGLFQRDVNVIARESSSIACSPPRSTSCACSSAAQRDGTSKRI